MLPFGPAGIGFSTHTEARGRMGPGLPGYGAREGMSHVQYASYTTNRNTRFYTRGLRRRGFYFGDPLLMVLLADSECEYDGLPCPDQSLYP